MTFTRVYPLPRKAIGTIVQTLPQLSISSFFKPRQQRITCSLNIEEDFYDNECRYCQYREQWNDDLDDYVGDCSGGKSVIMEDNCQAFSLDEVGRAEQIDIITKPYIFHIQLTPCNGLPVHNKVYIFMYEQGYLRLNKLLAMPYSMGNVYPDGQVCWGDTLYSNNEEDMTTPRSLHSSFWESGFNLDLVPSDYESVGDWMRDLDENTLQEHLNQNWEDYKPFIKGECYTGTDAQTEAVLISTDPSVTRKFRKKFKFREEEGNVINSIVAWIKQGEFTLAKDGEEVHKGYYIESGAFIYQRDNKNSIIGDRVYLIGG